MRVADSLTELCETWLPSRAGGVPAGGTDLWSKLRRPSAAGPARDRHQSLEELRGVDWEEADCALERAAYLELERDPLVQRHAPMLCRMGRDVGGPTIQARGTLGGNLATASPAADGVAALAAYDATIVVASAAGTRAMRLDELQTGYKQSSRRSDEVIVAIDIVPPAEGSPWMWHKVGTRLAQAISKVALGAVAEVNDGQVTRLGLGLASVAPVTCLLKTTRQYVCSKPLRDVTAEGLDEAVMEDISPIDDIRSNEAYARTAVALLCAVLSSRSMAKVLEFGPRAKGVSPGWGALGGDQASP